MIILRQIYIYALIIFVLLLGFYINITYIFSPETAKNKYHDHSHEIDDAVKNYYSSSDLTWEDLIKDCGSYVMTENSARANEIFNRKFYKKIITWKGYFLNAFVQTRNPMDFNPEHLMNINVRMIPSESIKNPDLFLSLDFKKYQSFGHIIRTFETGTPILFKASMEALGNEWRPHHLHLLSIEKTKDFIDHDHKVVLFKGVSFNITGHMRNDKEIRETLQNEKDDRVELEINSDGRKVETIINNTTSNNFEIKKEEIPFNNTNSSNDIGSLKLSDSELITVNNTEKKY